MLKNNCVFSDYNYSNGFLTDVSDNTGQFSWSNPTYNDLGMTETFDLGNGLSPEFYYDAHFMPDARFYSDGLVQDYDFNIKGNLEYRSDVVNANEENFTYDDQNRLIDSDIGASMAYNATTNNIDNKYDIGDYMYNGSSLHAVSTILNGPTNYNPPAQYTSYNSFNKIEYISTQVYNGTLQAQFTYGPNRNRTVMEVGLDGGTSYTKYYAGKLYNEVVDANNNTTTNSYIYVQGELMGLFKQDNNTGSEELYYVHTDYLGSVIGLSDQSGYLVEEYAYDAWGKRRDPLDWTQPDTRSNLLIDRGFTGHEHLDAFELINMNGRVYDPAVGMFLSPDPVLQNPGNALNYNRYSYCWNNPLKYTDPSGYRGVNWKDALAEAYEGVGGGSEAQVPGIGRDGIYTVGQLNEALDRYSGIMDDHLYHHIMNTNPGHYGYSEAEATAILAGEASYVESYLVGSNKKHVKRKGAKQNLSPGVKIKKYRRVYLPQTGAQSDGGNGPAYDGDAWFGTNFIGPGPDADPYSLPDPNNPGRFLQPIDAVDKAAQKHDYYYWKAGASGVKGALFDKNVATADAILARDAFNIIQSYHNGGIDGVTGLPISNRTYGIALGVFYSFTPISLNKFFNY